MAQQKEIHRDRHQLYRKRGTSGAAQGGGLLGGQLWPRVLPGQGAQTRTHQRVMGRGRQTRFFGGESARRVRRRRRRHVRTVAGDGGDGRRRLGAAADGGVTGHQRNHHRQVRHRRSEEALVAGHRRRLVDHGVRHHRARRRLQLTQDHHHRASRRQRLDHQGPESLYFWHRPGAGGAGRGPQRGSQNRQATPRVVRGAHRRSRVQLHPDRDGAGQPRTPVPGFPRRRPATRRCAGWSRRRGDRTAFRGPEPRAHHGCG